MNFFAKTREKSEGIFARRLHGWGIHHYSWNTSGGRTNDWNAGKGDAVKFGPEQYYELLAEADKIDKYIIQHWEIMGEYDRQHNTKIFVDEWGSWHKLGTELRPASDVYAYNSFENPRAVEPRDETVKIAGDTLVFNIAPASVTQFQLVLA